MTQLDELADHRLPGGDVSVEPGTLEAEEAQPKGGMLRQAMDFREVARSPYGLTPILLLSSTSFFLSLSTTVYALAGPIIIRDLHISFAAITRYQGFVQGFSVFLGLGLGYLGDRYRRVPMFGLGMIGGGLLNMLVARATGVASFGTPNIGSDALIQLGDTPVPSLFADYYPPQTRGRAFALNGVIAQGGVTFAPLLVGGLLSLYSWRVLYVVLSIPIVLIGVLSLIVLREPVRGYMERKSFGVSDEEAGIEEERPSFSEAFRTILAIKTLRRLFVTYVVIGFGSVGLGASLVFILFTNYGLTTGQLGVVTFGQGLMSLVAVSFSGGVIDFFNRRRPGAVLSFVGVVLLVLSAVVFVYSVQPPLWLFITVGCLGTFALTMLAPTFGIAFVQVLPPNVRTLGVQLLHLAQVPGLIVWVPFIATLSKSHGLFSLMTASWPWFALAAFMMFGAAPLFEADTRSAFAASQAGMESRRAREAGQTKLLVCRDVDVAYGGVQVLFGVDFDLVQGEIVALLGTNGAGKSTLLRAISGTQEASSGAIVFDGRDTTHMPPHEIAARGVIHMPGGRGTFPGLTVKENLLLGTWMSDPSQAAERMPEVLEMFPILAERADEPAAALSGGEQQMLSLAQAFLARPRLLMIDELSLGLSPAVVGQLLDVVRTIHASGTTVVVVEQSVNVALALASRAIFMEKGEVKFVGETAELMRRPDILRAVYVKGTGGATAAPRTQAQDQEGRSILQITDLRKTYGGVTAIDGLSVSVREGQALGIIGPNGSGKTTLFDLISGYQQADAGTITYDGVDVTGLAPEERARRRLVRRFQDARLFPSLTVYETLLVALDQRQEVKSLLLTVGSLPSARRSEKRIRLRAERLIELMELGAFRDKFVKELSTGVRRVVDLACVLATEPKLLLLDEPSSGIAQAEAENLAPLLRRVTYETGCTLMIIEHDMPLICAVSDELLALERGQLLTRGRPADVLEDERVVAAYLGGSTEAVRRSGVLPT